jgi:hypothetical protein
MELKWGVQHNYIRYFDVAKILSVLLQILSVRCTFELTIGPNSINITGALHLKTGNRILFYKYFGVLHLKTEAERGDNL